MLVVLTVASMLAPAAPALAAPALDPRFGEQGLVRTPLPGPLQRSANFSGRGPLLEDLTLQHDGRMVGVLASGTESAFVGAVRYFRGGRLDPSFGDAGFASVGRGFSKYDAQGQAVTIQRDRRILLVGYREDHWRNVSPFLARLRFDGTPDLSFGARGWVSPRARRKNGLALHGVAVQRNGRIVAVGTRNERKGGKPAGVVIAYRPDGRVDRRFGRNGRVAFPNRRDGYTALRDIEILPGGKMLVTGYLAGKLFVARLWQNGKLDRSFGHGDGKVAIGIGPVGCCALDVSLRTLAGGSSVALTRGPFGGSVLVALRPDGKRRNAFGHGGVISDSRSTLFFDPAALAIQGNGRIVAVGMSLRRHDSKRAERPAFSIFRYLPNGRRDRSFAKNGVKRLPFGYNSTARAAVTLPNGSVLVGGGAQLLNPPGTKDEAGFEVKFAYDLALAKLRR